MIFETAGARLTLFKNGNIQLEGKSVCINGTPIELNPGGAAASSAEADSAPASDAGGDGVTVGGAGGAEGGGGTGVDAEGGGLSTSTPPPGAIAAGTEEFGKRGENLMKSTTPLKNGEFKYYDNGWKGNQHVKTQNVLNKKAMTFIADKAPIVGGLLDVLEVIDGIKADGNKWGKNTTKELAGVAGSSVGASGGGYLGALVGTTILPGAGTIIGGAIGVIVGSWGGEEFFEWMAGKIL